MRRTVLERNIAQNIGLDLDRHFLNIQKVNCPSTEDTLAVHLPKIQGFSYYPEGISEEVIVNFTISKDPFINNCSTKEAFKKVYYNSYVPAFEGTPFTLIKRDEGKSTMYFGKGIILMNRLPIFVATTMFPEDNTDAPTKHIILTDRLFTKFTESNKFILQTLLPYYMEMNFTKIILLDSKKYKATPLIFTGLQSVQQILLDHADAIIEATK